MTREEDNSTVVFAGYPNWWGDMPMILYSFLENADLSGKRVIPFVTHGGSGFSGTVETIAKLQPRAAVDRKPLICLFFAYSTTSIFICTSSP